MNIVTVTPQSWKPEDKHQKAAPYSGKGLLIKPDTIIQNEEGERLGFSIDVGERVEGLAWLTARMKELKWYDGAQQRLSGLTNSSRTFGFAPPVPLRRRYGATISQFDLDYPKEATVLRELGNVLWQTIEEFLPEMAAVHKAKMQEIHKDWWYGQSPFTSGIINNTSALPYHIDRGNVDGTLAALICLRKHMDGGMLHVPEINSYFELPHMSVGIFNNQKLWHGVTPFTRKNRLAERYSIVYYSKREFLKAGPLEDEAGRAAKRRTEFEA